jgi:glycosyltransferase involved in cell wall biosynthesis
MIELSVIVPILNEAETLPALFAMLSRQEQVAFELILADGGSTDGTAALAEERAAASPFAIRIVRSEKGRGRQLNAGTRAAVAGTFLFLHADSAFPDALALRRGLDTLAAALARRGDGRAAALPCALRSPRAGTASAIITTSARRVWGGRRGFTATRGFSFPAPSSVRWGDSMRHSSCWRTTASPRRYEGKGRGCCSPPKSSPLPGVLKPKVCTSGSSSTP